MSGLTSGLGRSFHELAGCWTHHVSLGDSLPAVDGLQLARRHLLWLARLAEDASGYWLTPSRGEGATVGGPGPPLLEVPGTDAESVA